jgi:hypothetical protein
MRDPIFHPIRAQPSAEETLSRLACARARVAALDVASLVARGRCDAATGRRRERLASSGARPNRTCRANRSRLQDDFLEFHIARDMDLREIGLLYYVLNSSDPLGEALRRGQRYCAVGYWDVKHTRFAYSEFFGF